MPKRRQPYHLAHFAILIFGLFFFTSLILIFRSSRIFQLLLVFAMSFYYLLWGVIHHHHEGSLHPRIVLEYLLIACIGTSLLGFIIYML